MRNEREIIEKILDAARQDDSVRVVIRTNLVPKRKYLYSNIDQQVSDSGLASLFPHVVFLPVLFLYTLLRDTLKVGDVIEYN